MLKFKEYRRLLEKGVTESQANGGNEVDARETFVNDFRMLLGITEDENGNPVIAKGAMRPDEVNIPLLAEAIFGMEKTREFFYHDSGPDRRTILESGPLDPSAMLNINTFSLTVGGLLEARIIAAFNNPAYIGERLVTTMPTRKNGEKMIGVTGTASEGKTRAPGKPHPRTGLGNHYITTPELEEKALAIDITKEVVRYDLTGDVLRQAGAIGDSLAYGREKTRLSLVIGGSNPYVYNGVGYNTYQTTTPWVNNQQNEFADLSDLENSKKLFRRMRDPATNREIMVEGWQVLVAPDREISFDRVLNATEVRETTNTNTVTIGGNPIKGRYEIMSSQIEFNLRQAAAADGGLALDETNSLKRWYHGDFKKAFAWMEAEPLTTRQASPGEYLMMDHGLIASFFSSYVGIGAVIEPRYVVVNTH
jgi:hypothetical protein